MREQEREVSGMVRNLLRRILMGRSDCEGCSASILGACRDGAFCDAERNLLFERAQEEAAEQGHELGAFAKQEHRSSWRAHCLHCGLQIEIHLDPRSGEREISGPLLNTPCEDS